jgi:hypothetical protein
MTDLVVKIGEKTFRLKFGLRVLRALGERLGLADFESVVQKVVDSAMLNKGEFEKIDVLHNLIVVAVELGGNEEKITVDELDDLFLADFKNHMDLFGKVIEGFMKSMPVEDLGKIQAQVMSQLEEAKKTPSTKLKKSPAAK